MQKWEHKFLVAEKHGKGVFGLLIAREISWKVHYVDGKQLKNWEDVTLYTYLDKMGADGWCVAAMVPHVSIRTGQFPVEHLYLVLKRPLNAGSA
jgi:hypothetical protein